MHEVDTPALEQFGEAKNRRRIGQARSTPP